MHVHRGPGLRPDGRELCLSHPRHASALLLCGMQAPMHCMASPNVPAWLIPSRPIHEWPYLMLTPPSKYPAANKLPSAVQEMLHTRDGTYKVPNSIIVHAPLCLAILRMRSAREPSARPPAASTQHCEPSCTPSSCPNITMQGPMQACAPTQHCQASGMRTLCLATDFCSGNHSPKSEPVADASCCVTGLYAMH